MLILVKAQSLGAATEQSIPSEQEVLVDRERRRLEELMIWKMSEELKLPILIEAQFTEVIRNLNVEKGRSNNDLATSLIELGQAKTDKEADLVLKRFEKAIRRSQQVPLNEFKRLKRLLGPQKLARYFVAKSQMVEKLKALSSAPIEPVAPSSDPNPEPTPKAP